MRHKRQSLTGREGLEAVLFWAAEYGTIERVMHLVAIGVDVNCCDENGYTPLHFAAQRGDREIFEFLVRHGANTRKKDIANHDALFYVYDLNQEEIMHYLKVA